MKMKTLFASIAIAGLAFAQPASAATRSASSLPERGVQTTAAADRVGSITGEAEDANGKTIAVIILLLVVVVAILAGVGGNKSNG